MRRRSPHEELTDAKNRRITATLTPKAWSKMVTAEVRANHYATDGSLDAVAKLVHPMADMVEIARETSGSIMGEHRKDLVDAMKGAEMPPIGLALPQGTEQPPESTSARRSRAER